MNVARRSCVVVLSLAIRGAGGRERELMHDIREPEVAEGTITEDELDAVTGHRKEKRAAVRARDAGVGRHREKHILRATRDLAADLAKAGGDSTPQVEHARGEIARVRGAPPAVEPA